MATYDFTWQDPYGKTVRNEINGQLERYMNKWVETAAKSMARRASHWPAKKNTSNFGPYSKQHSIRLFGSEVKRNGMDFDLWITNSARSKSGHYYARMVNEGRNSQGYVSHPRRVANTGAVQRTIGDAQEQISRVADRHSIQGGDR